MPIRVAESGCRRHGKTCTWNTNSEPAMTSAHTMKTNPARAMRGIGRTSRNGLRRAQINSNVPNSSKAPPMTT